MFDEMYQSFLDGRTANDPAASWYEGELWFFDNHVIPLAKRLKEFGCFGVSGADFLNNAEQNRFEWSEKGRDIVKELLATKKQSAEPLTPSNNNQISPASNRRVRKARKTSDQRKATLVQQLVPPAVQAPPPVKTKQSPAGEQWSDEVTNFVDC